MQYSTLSVNNTSLLHNRIRIWRLKRSCNNRVEINPSRSTQSYSYRTNTIDVSAKKRECESFKYNPDYDYLDILPYSLSKVNCHTLPDNCHCFPEILQRDKECENVDKLEMKLMEPLTAKSSPAKSFWGLRRGRAGQDKWYSSLRALTLGNSARTCKQEALNLLSNDSWDLGRTYVTLAYTFADHPKFSDPTGTWKKDILKAAALTCQKTAYKSFAQFRWEDGKAGIDLACEFGNQLGNEKWFKVLKEDLSKGVAQVCEPGALQHPSDNLGPLGVMDIELAYLLGKKSGDVTRLECWKQDTPGKAAEAFSKGATVVSDKTNWKDLQARMEVTCAPGRKDWWFRMKTLTSKL